MKDHEKTSITMGLWELCLQTPFLLRMSRFDKPVGVQVEWACAHRNRGVQ